MAELSLTVNGRIQQIDIDPETPLLWALRETLGLTGTKFGCGAGLCGCCTVHVDGEALRSCVTPVSRISDKRIVTIEGIGASRLGTFVKKASLEEDVVQCGYCQPGQIMAATALLHKYPNPTDEQIDRGMAGVIFRCATYVRIRKAIHRAAEASKGVGQC